MITIKTETQEGRDLIDRLVAEAEEMERFDRERNIADHARRMAMSEFESFCDGTHEKSVPLTTRLRRAGL